MEKIVLVHRIYFNIDIYIEVKTENGNKKTSNENQNNTVADCKYLSQFWCKNSSWRSSLPLPDLQVGL